MYMSQRRKALAVRDPCSNLHTQIFGVLKERVAFKYKLRKVTLVI